MLLTRNFVPNDQRGPDQLSFIVALRKLSTLWHRASTVGDTNIDFSNRSTNATPGITGSGMGSPPGQRSGGSL